MGDRLRDGLRWLNVDAFDANGKPQHQRGVSKEPGIYFVGLPWLSRRGSSFIWGVWHDAKHIADHIATQRKYVDYHDAAQRRGHASARQDDAARLAPAAARPVVDAID